MLTKYRIINTYQLHILNREWRAYSKLVGGSSAGSAGQGVLAASCATAALSHHHAAVIPTRSRSSGPGICCNVFIRIPSPSPCGEKPAPGRENSRRRPVQFTRSTTPGSQH